VASLPSEMEEGLLETLVYDSSEHFFSSQTQQQAARFIGSQIRTDDGSNPEYGVPFYDVYQLTEPIRVAPTEQVRIELGTAVDQLAEIRPALRFRAAAVGEQRSQCTENCSDYVYTWSDMESQSN
jgi:hypothetical protein